MGLINDENQDIQAAPIREESSKNLRILSFVCLKWSQSKIENPLRVRQFRLDGNRQDSNCLTKSKIEMMLYKKLSCFIAWVLIAFLIITTSPLIYAQDSVSSEKKIDGIPVILNGKTLFVVREKIGSFSPEERAKAITRRLEKIANDPSIDVDTLKIEEEKDNTTSLILGHQVIITYTDRPTMMARTYSELHQNIQDKCNEVGIEIMSPHYSAIRDGNQNTIPEDYLPKDYTIPGFRIHSLVNQSSKLEPLTGQE